jgi:hypothetical protein
MKLDFRCAQQSVGQYLFLKLFKRNPPEASRQRAS